MMQSIQGRDDMSDNPAPVETEIARKLTEAYFEGEVAVENESHMHNVPPDSETHFKVTVVSDSFEGKNRVKRHQAVYSVLQEEMNNGVHALALHTYTPAEWASRSEASPASPNCMGGSKHDHL
jgi:BolA protein